MAFDFLRISPLSHLEGLGQFRCPMLLHVLQMCVVLYMYVYFRGNFGSLYVAGYTVSSVTVGDWRRLYVAGAPRFKHKGKVILFDLSLDGDVNITQAIEGEQVQLFYSSLHLFICLQHH